MSYWPAISADGRFVAFASAADDLVAGDTNREIDVFVRDRVAGATERVSVGHQGLETTNVSLGFPALSADGAVVAFTSRARELLPVGEDTNGRADILVRDRTRGVTTRASIPTGGGQSDAGSVEAALSGDGGTVVFYSAATNLVPGDANGVFDVFRHQRATVTTTRLTAGDAATFVSGTAVSADGTVVTFYGAATNLVPGDTNEVADVFVWTP
jgi:Tol biopolymer transport system component